MNAIKFYQSTAGDNILNPSSYPLEVTRYLNAEQSLLEIIIHKYQMLVEVGCSDGRHLDIAYKKNKHYIGIDIIPNKILAGRQKIRRLNFDEKRCKFLCRSAEEISDAIEDSKNEGFEFSKALIFFPFNVLGNMNINSFDKVISDIRKLNMDVYFSLFETDHFSTKVREEYYQNCGCEDLEKLPDFSGVRFISREGLNSISYHSRWFLEKTRLEGILLEERQLAKVGVAYVSMTSASLTGVQPRYGQNRTRCKET